VRFGACVAEAKRCSKGDIIREVIKVLLDMASVLECFNPAPGRKWRNDSGRDEVSYTIFWSALSPL
jgi:hypothetical protein